MERELPGPVHCLPVVGGAPAGAVDVDQLRHVADGGSLDDVRHEGLVQHPDTCGRTGAGKRCGRVRVHRRQGGDGSWVLDVAGGSATGPCVLESGGQPQVQPHTVG